MFRTRAVQQARLQICFQRRTGAPQKLHQHNQVRLWWGLWHVHQNRKETRQTEWKIREIASKEDKLSNYHHFNGFRRVQWGKRLNQGAFLDKLWIENSFRFQLQTRTGCHQNAKTPPTACDIPDNYLEDYLYGGRVELYDVFTYDNYGWPNDKRVGVGIGYLEQLNQFYSVYFL